MATDIDHQQQPQTKDNNGSASSNEENLRFYNRFKECTEQNRKLNQEFAKILDNKYNIILEISAIQRGELYEEKAGMVEEDDDDNDKIPEYDPSEAWISKFSKAARENVALLKRINELKDEIQELSEQRNTLAAQMEFKSATNGRKKMRGGPSDLQDLKTGGTETRQLFGRIDPQERIEALLNSTDQGRTGTENNNANRSLFNPFNDYNPTEQRGQGGYRGPHNQQGGDSWFKKI